MAGRGRIRMPHDTPEYLAATHEQVFGINARVITGGRVGAGEAVELRPGATGLRASGR